MLPEKTLFRVPVAFDVLLGLFGFLAFAVTVYAGLAGTDVQSENLAPTVVYVAFWVGVPFASLAFGNVFAAISPWRALGRGDRLGRRQALAGRDAGAARVSRAPRPHPRRCRAVRLRDLRALLGSATQPGPLAIIMLGYLVVMLLGSASTASSRGPPTPTRSASSSG